MNLCGDVIQGETNKSFRGNLLRRGGLKSEGGFSLIELMVVVAIIAILVLIGAPSYQTFIAKARQKEGFSLLQGYYVAASSARAEMGFFKGNLVASGFAPTGELGYRLRVANDNRAVPYGSNDDGCLGTNVACNCGGACPQFKTWSEKDPGTVGGVIGPVTCSTAPTIDANLGTFTAVAAGVIRNQGNEDCYSINERKELRMISDGLN